MKIIRIVEGVAVVKKFLLLAVSACGALTLVAQEAPVTREGLPNFDLRARSAEAAAAPKPTASPITTAASSGNASIASASLSTGVADAWVDRDAITGSPAFVRSARGFLTGQVSSGGTVSNANLQALSASDPHRMVKAFIDSNQALFGHRSDVLSGARVTRDYITPHNKMRTVVWEQQLDGIQIFEATLKAHLTENGELINIASGLVADPAQAAQKGASDPTTSLNTPKIFAQAAVVIAAKNIGEELAEASVTASDAPAGTETKQHFHAPHLNSAEARVIWLPLDSASMRLCWEVLLTSKIRGQMFRVIVDAESGEPLVRHCLTKDIGPATYRVFTSDSPSPFSPALSTPAATQPALVSRTLVTLSALNITASPNGWIDDGVIETRGNNVDAHTDTNDDDLPDLPRPQATGTNRLFDPALDLTQAPSTYKNAAVVNLFYWCNWMHDKLYALGFNEAAGNFQNNNFGHGGLGNDAVQADAQDGGDILDSAHRNNANFTSPPDGSPGRMQMYIFTGPTPNRDGDFDTEVVLHEYTHGLSDRLVGGGVGISALQTGGMGEGWSDFYAMTLLSEAGDNINGNYASGGYASYLLESGFTQNYYYGIRRYPYSTDLTKNPLTFRDIDYNQASSHTGIPISPTAYPTANEVHNMGEVWCVTLWDARANLITKYGYTPGNQLILQLVTDGMKLAPANPNFLQARDAIIQADLVDNAGANRKELWAAFAKRGMGANASSPSSNNTTGVVENFDLPDDLSVTPNTTLTVGGAPGGPFTPSTKVYTLTNNGTASLDWTAAKTQTWTSLDVTSGTLAVGATANVTLTITATSLTAGSYNDTVTFTNTTSGVSQKRTVALTVITPPTITTQPSNVTAYVGNSISLSVSASGTGTLTYQWQKDGVNLVSSSRIYGVTSSYLSISNAQSSDAGQYTVIITNAGGSTTSNAATITVNIPPVPVISTQPASQSIYVGQSISLSVSTSITGTTTYQWQKSSDNGTTFTNITNATNSSFNISSSQTSDTGQYRIIISNPGGSTTSNAATVTVTTPPVPVISTQPASQSIYLGQAISLSVSTAITGKTTYQWQKSTDNGATFTDIATATSSSFSISRSQASDAGQYRVIITNPGGSTTSNAATITFSTSPVPVITAQPASQSVYLGQALNLKVGVSVTGITSFQWQKSTDNGATFTDIATATGSTFSISASQASDAGQYRVIITNPGGSTTSNAATITVSALPAPVITTQPTSQSVYLGQSINLSVSANNTGTTTYQWQKSTDSGATFINIQYATSSYFSIYTSQASDAGQYRVIVTNPGGSTTSSVATITVSVPPAPVITTQPTPSQSVYVSQSINLSVSANNTGTTTYQWQKSTDSGATFTNIANATSSYFNIYNSQASDAGQYRVIITNPGGSTTSSVATVTVSVPPAPVITTQPITQSVYVSQTINLNVGTTNTGTTSFQWQKSTDSGATFINIQYATSSYFSIYASQASDAGQYRVIITNPGGSTTSNAATITVSIPPAPVITTQPTSQSIYLGQSIYLAVGITNTGTTSYQWQKSTDSGATFINIKYATSSYYNIYTSQSSDAGQYRVIITNQSGSTTSAAAAITFTTPPPPVIITQPISQSVFLGESIYLNVNAAVTGTTTYQWQKSTDGGVTFANVTSATSYYFNISPSQASDAGQYQVIVTNPGGSTTSAAATITLVTPLPPTLSTQPTSTTTIQEGNSLYLSAYATGRGNITYQWQKDGVNLPNQTSGYLSIYGVTMSDAGKYCLVATNAGGSVTSNSATVTVTAPPPPAIYSQPSNVTTTAGNSVSFYAYASGVAPLTYQWQKDGLNLTNGGRISGATSSSLTISNTQVSDAGQYRVIVSNDGGSVTSTAVTLTVNNPPPPTIATQPTDVTTLEGSSFNLYSYASASTPIAYQWYQDGSAILGATAITYSKTVATLSDAGLYKLAATNAGGTVYSREAKVTITPGTAPVFVIQPQNQAAYAGGSVTFTASATALPAPTYQWYKDVNAISGATTNVLTLSSLTSTNDGEIYTVKATNIAGTATSSTASLAIYAADSGKALSITPATRIVGCGRVVYPITLRCNTDWTATKSTNWISLSVTSGTYNQALEVTVAPNPLPVERNATITIGQQTHTLTQRAAGTPISELWATGANDLGQLGDYRLPPITVPAQADSAVQSIAKSDGTLWAADANTYGQLGYAISGTETRATPICIASEIQTAAAGDNHSLYVKNDGSCWSVGDNSAGQLGDGSTTTRYEPAPILSGIKAVTAGYSHSLLLKTDGTLLTAGLNNYGQLGDGSSVLLRATPSPVATTVVATSAGTAHSLLLKADATLFATGSNFSGQLGNGTNISRSTPAQVASGVLSSAAGGAHTLLLKTNGTLWATGYNWYGQLGIGSKITQYTPVQVVGSYLAMAAGQSHSLFVKSDNTAWSAGDNTYGQLGDSSTTARATPVPVLSGVKAVAAGQYHSFWLKTDNTLWASGDGSSGQLGNGSYNQQPSTPIIVATNILSVFVGSTHSLFLASGDIRTSYTPPAITGFLPTAPTAGSSVTINGSGFNNVLGVYFNNVQATSYSTSSSTQIVAVAPSTDLANLRVTVGTFDGVASSNNSSSSSSSSSSSGGSGSGSSSGGGGGAPALWYFAAIGAAGIARFATILARRR